MPRASILRLTVSAAVLCAPFAMAMAHAAQPERPYSPWVARSVFDGEPRVLTIALAEDLWAAYHTETGSLRSLWSGTPRFQGAVYDGRHGPQPEGPDRRYTITEKTRHWTLMVNGERRPAQVQYLGHVVGENQESVALRYKLTAGTTAPVTVLEYPERTGERTLRRRFTVEENADNATPMLLVQYQSIDDAADVTCTGRWLWSGFKTDPDKGRTFWAEVALGTTGETDLTATFSSPAVDTSDVAEASNTESQQTVMASGDETHALMESTGCYTCHADESEIIGPSYAQVREKYDATPGNARYLASKILAGGVGVWGDVPMPAHDMLSDDDALNMAANILAMDATATQEAMARPPISAETMSPTPVTDLPEGFVQGLTARVYEVGDALERRPVIATDSKPNAVGLLPHPSLAPDPWTDNLSALASLGDGQYGARENYVVQFEGSVYVPETGAIHFEMMQFSGLGVLRVAGRTVIDFESRQTNEGTIELEAGWHPVEMEAYFPGDGQKLLLVSMFGPGISDDQYANGSYWATDESTLEVETAPGTKAYTVMPPSRAPGDGIKLAGMHPAFSLKQARPDSFHKRIGAMDFLSDGRLVVSTWDAEGGVYVLDGVADSAPNDIKVKKIAEGLAEPLGLKVIEDDRIFIMQKQELTEIVDTDGDEVTDFYRTVSNDWAVTDNFHEFGFGLVYDSGDFYATLAAGVLPGGEIAPIQGKGRGSLVRINEESGEAKRVAHGFRAPNGVGRGPGEGVYVADNQGNWLPASKIVRVQEDGFYGYRGIDPDEDMPLDEDPPLVWLPQTEIGNSPTQMAPLYVGPYQGQLVHGDVHHGGLKRTSVDTVNGVDQGCVFRFAQGLESASHRLAWGPDNALYVGQIGVGGNWGVPGLLNYGLQKLEYSGERVFEILEARAVSGGLELTLSEPIATHSRLYPEDIAVEQWRYDPTADYGGPKLDVVRLTVDDVRLSEDRTKAFVMLPNMAAGRVLHVRMARPPVSQEARELYTAETYCTINALPTDRPVPRDAVADLPPNMLSEAERAAGWQPLFDGETLNGWRGFKQDAPPANWAVEDGMLTLIQGGVGDIITEATATEFELSLEWKISENGNSGIFYHIQEAESANTTYESAPEMQVLDNDGHPDSRFPSHRAGALYDLKVPAYSNTMPVGQFNRARIIVDDDRIEHWLNGRLVAASPYGGAEWQEMIASSKFKEMPLFGQALEGHFGLQDHDDRVWYRSIKYRSLAE